MMKKNIDLLLVTPPSRLEVYQSLSNDFAAIEPPVWSGLIAEFIRGQGFSVQVLDAEALGFTHQETATAIIEANAVLTTYVIYGQQPSASTQCMPGGRKVAKIVSENSDLPSLVMGTHASALPERTLTEEPYSFVCEGEGPYTIASLLQALKERSERFNHVPGLWYQSNGKVHSNPVAQNIKDLNHELPSQAWDLLDMSKYRAHNWHCFDHIQHRKPYASLQTSLGCPYKCSFCCINAPFGSPSIRYWSPDNVITQIEILVEKYDIKNIKIPDEMFVLNTAHVTEICEKIIDRGYQLNIWAYARIDTVKDEFLGKLKKAGFNWLGIGIESGSKHVRDGVKKGRFGELEIVKTVQKIRQHGIYVGANYIFGLPDDTHKTMQETLNLAQELNTEWANFYCGMAYPGSPLFTEAKRRGWRLPDDANGPGWLGYSQHAYDTLPLQTETLAAEEVLRFRDSAFNAYFTNPPYLRMIRDTFGEKVLGHIKTMISHKLSRRYNS